MKYTNLEGEVFNFDGFMYRTLSDKTPRGPVNGHGSKRIITHINIDGDDYVEFHNSYYVKVDDMYNRDPYDSRIIFDIFTHNSNETVYEIY